MIGYRICFCTNVLISHPAGSQASYFVIDSSSGAITTNAQFDFESDATTTYGDGTVGVLAVMVTDTSTATHEAPLTITINDVSEDPVLSQPSYTGTVAESPTTGLAVTVPVAIAATDDEDVASLITYTLVGKVCFKIFFIKK
jgi:hypothetical protein